MKRINRTLLAIFALCAATAPSQAVAEDAYIRSDNGTFVNLGYFPGPKTKFEIDFQLTARKYGQDVLFGYYNNNNECSFLLYHPTNSPNFKLCAKDGTYANCDMTPPVPQDFLRHKAVIDMPVTNVAMYAADGTLQGQTNFAGKGWTFTKTSEYPLTLFGSCIAADGSKATQLTNAKIYGAKIWESEDNGATYTLLHDFIPASKNGVAGFFDCITGEFKSVRDAAKASYFGDPYVESDWATPSAVIDTGYHFTPTSRVEMAFQFLKTPPSNGDYYILGGQGQAAGEGYVNFLAQKLGQFVWSCSWANGGSDIWQQTGVDNDTRRHFVAIDAAAKKAWLVTGGVTNSVKTFATGLTGSIDRTLRLFSAQGETARAPARVYGCKIYEGGVLVHNFVPATTNGVAGLFDSVDGVFVTANDPASLAYGGSEDPFVVSEAANVAYCIDTGLMIGADTAIEADFEFLATSKEAGGVWQQFVYAADDADAIKTRIYLNGGDGDGGISWTHSKGGNYTAFNSEKMVPGVRYRTLVDGFNKTAKLWADGTLKATVDSATFTSTVDAKGGIAGTNTVGSIKLFNHATGGHVAMMKLYGFKIYEAGELVHDYVPAVRSRGIGEYANEFDAGLLDRSTGEMIFNTTTNSAGAVRNLGAGGAINVVNDDYIESFGTYAFSSGYFFNPKSLVEVDYALTGGCTNYLVRGIEMGGAAVGANGLAITNENDGAIWVKGEATASTTFYISSGSVSEGSIPDTAWQTLPAGKYIVSGISQGGVDIGVSLRLLYRSGSSASRYVSVIPYEGLAIDNSGGAYSKVALCIYVPNGATCQSDDVRGVKFLPIIRRFGDNVEQVRLLGADKDTGDDNCTTRFAYYINRSGNMSFLYADKAQGSAVTLSTAKKNDTRRHTAIFDAAAGKARYVTGGKTEWTGAVDTSKIAETATNPIGVFADCMNADGTVFSAGSYTAARIYRLKISEVEGGVTNLVHDFIPEKRNGVPGMLDRVTGEFIAGADQDRACGAFEIGGDNAAAAANGDAYVESSGVSCMNSRFLMNPDAKIEVDFAMVDVETDAAGQYDAGLHYQQRVFAADSGGNALMTGLYVNNNHDFSFSLGNRLADGGAVTNGFVGFSTGIPADTRRHKAIVDAYGKTLSLETEGTTVWSNALTEFFETNYTATATFPIALFGNCNNAAGTSFRAGNPYEKSKSRVYGVKIWQAGVLVHNYKPRVKGGMAGFYDSVDGAFITGENVASFWAGGNVERVDDDPYVATPGNNIKKGGLYVDTGYFAKPSTRFELDYAILEPYRGRYSDGSTSGNGDWFLFSGYGGGSAYFHFYYSHNMMGWGAGKTSWANIGGDGLGNHTWTNSPVNVRRTVVLDQPGGKASVVTAGYTNYTATISNPGDYSASSVKIAAWYRLNGGYAPMKIYGVRIYEDGALVHAFEPRLNNGTVAGLYDTVTHVFASAGDEAAIPDEDKSGDALSYGGPVAGVDTDAYLESFGAQAIDTGYKPNPKSRFEIDYALTDVTAAGQMRPFSNNGGKTWAEFYVQGTAGTAGSTMAFGWGDSWKAIGSLVGRDTTRRQAVLDLATGEYGITGGKNSDTDPVVKPTISKESTNSLNIFDKSGTATADSNNVPAKMKLYSFRIYETDGGVRTLLHEYLPYCGPDENGVVVTSLWDTVEGKALAPVLASGADPFSIGGMGWYGSGSKYNVAPEDGELTKVGRTLFAYAPGAVRYEWTCDGAAVAGGENGALDVAYSAAKAHAGVVETYTATAYYMVDGVEVKGAATTVEVTYKSYGMAIQVL